MCQRIMNEYDLSDPEEIYRLIKQKEDTNKKNRIKIQKVKNIFE